MGSTYPRYNSTSSISIPVSGCRKLSEPISGLLFDMGDVLYDATVWRRWLIQLLRRFDLHLDYTTLFKSWDRCFLLDVHRGRRPLCDAFQSL